MTGPQRFPHSVYRLGDEPDPRFSLANERTSLAWIRTSLALIALGVALEALQIPTAPPIRLSMAILFIALGALAAVQSWIGWSRVELSLRLAKALPGAGFTAVIATGALIGALVIVVGLLV
ncbi:YidH family protein [Cryobacterium tagatosivorans]|uniref:DUF202 domain-containing protein n=1 Tax=Cryobacterium tagatosivorans TaxID=1259199 RepID=A0A4R8UFY9_9MICO|nr:DUF202 domain-containing protein [Cryobacterium tagatosivorans]TFB53616.1 DUF202 domain-containing protein [Cryobacterium tagatosivorans]